MFTDYSSVAMQALPFNTVTADARTAKREPPDIRREGEPGPCSVVQPALGALRTNDFEGCRLKRNQDPILALAAANQLGHALQPKTRAAIIVEFRHVVKFKVLVDRHLVPKRISTK